MWLERKMWFVVPCRPWGNTFPQCSRLKKHRNYFYGLDFLYCLMLAPLGHAGLASVNLVMDPRVCVVATLPCRIRQQRATRSRQARSETCAADAGFDTGFGDVSVLFGPVQAGICHDQSECCSAKSRIYRGLYRSVMYIPVGGSTPPAELLNLGLEIQSESAEQLLCTTDAAATTRQETPNECPLEHQ